MMKDCLKISPNHSMKIFLSLFLLLSFTQISRGQIVGPVPEGQLNSMYQNGISNMSAYGDTLWIGPMLQRHIGQQMDWYTANKADSVINGRGRLYSIDLAKDTVVAGLGYSVSVSGSATDTGLGYYTSTDGGNNWTFIPLPLEAKTDTLYQYGSNTLAYLPVVVPQQSPPYDVKIHGNTIFSVNWAMGLIRSTDFGKTWKRIILPPSNVDTLSPTHKYTFKYDPRTDDNFLGFGLCIDHQGYVWVGTADGVNISPNVLTTPRDSVIWYHKQASSAINGLLGNWVITIKKQPGTNRVWLTNWTTGSSDKFGIVSSDNHGRTFRHYLIGEKIYDIAFHDSTIFAAGDNGLFISLNDGKTWDRIHQIKSANTFIKQNAAYYSVARTSQKFWVGTSNGLASTSDNGKTWDISRVNFPLKGGNRFQKDAPNINCYAYPNPFSRSQDGIVRIKFNVPNSGNVTIKLYDFGMNLIRVLDNKYVNSGTHEAVWNGLDAHGNRVANGVVFYQIKTSKHTFGGKILVLQ